MMNQQHAINTRFERWNSMASRHRRSQTSTSLLSLPLLLRNVSSSYHSLPSLFRFLDFWISFGVFLSGVVPVQFVLLL